MKAASFCAGSRPKIRPSPLPTTPRRARERSREAEDPAPASTTQRAPDAKALVLPTIQHAPSYLGHQPTLKDLPAPPPALRIPSAHPPAPVEKSSAPIQIITTSVSTLIRFSPELDSLITP